MKYCIALVSIVFFNMTFVSAQLTDIFKYKVDIGNPKNPGSYVYNPIDQSYLLRGSGYNIWFERDEFHYMYNKIKGDFIITANFRLEGKGANAHRKTGMMLRA